ncbi:hypothetical protein [Mycobacterium heckeshornense]|uniref:hypothetical protein n=1 Tax=Mycobacterium heckeshornense TaxID=110505 RepID=UPI000662C22C|nr:hypothetical protein [Mycobacterium heckeshornense]
MAAMVVAEDAFTEPARRAVAELLRLRGRTITLVPAVGVVAEKPGGGKDYAPAEPRSAQRFAVFNTGGFDGRENSQTDQGMTRKFQFKLVGSWDAVIEIGDAWEDDVAKYQIDSVDRTKPYQIEALVVGFLKETGHSFG